MDTELPDGMVAEFRNEPGLEVLLGGKYIYRYQKAAPPMIPCVTIHTGNDTGGPAIGYNHSGIREHDFLVVLDHWSNVSDQHLGRLEAVCERLVLRGRAYTWNWLKVGCSEPMWDEDVQAWHKVARYSAEQAIKDTI